MTDGNNGPVSKVQIKALEKEKKELNEQRPQPEQRVEYTPDGPEVQQVMSDEAQKQNAEIDKGLETRDAEIARMQQWLDRRAGDATREFNQARER